MTTSSPTEIAEMYASSARANFERGEGLAPILVFHTERQSVICMMAGTDDMPAAYGRTLAVGTPIWKPEFVITVTEVWQRSIHDAGNEDEARAKVDKVRRGDLARDAEAGDPSVRTALMTMVWSIDPDQSVSIIDTVQDDGTYDRIQTDGVQEGWMVDCVMGGWKHGRSVRPPPFELPPELAAQVVALTGDVVAVAFETEEPVDDVPAQ